MSMWAKILGGVAGMAVAGPFGAVIGAALGHAAENGGLGRAGLLDGLLGAGAHANGGPDLGPARVAAMFGRRDEVFALCVVVLSAKLAKCDGPVSRAEVDAFKRTFRVPEQAAADIGRLFDRARADPDGFEAYATQLGETFADSPRILEDVLTGLFQIARADGPLTGRENHVLQVVSIKLRLDRAAWDRASGQASRAAGSGGGGSVGRVAEDAYAVLGVPRSAADDVLRAHWKGLVRRNHPDTLTGSGASSDQVARASAALARINAAWDSIKRERGL